MKYCNRLILILCCLLLISCSNTDEQKYNQLRLDVLKHYQHDSNKLKFKAALFLLNNMRDRHSIDAGLTEAYGSIIKKYYQNGDTLHKKLLSMKFGYTYKLMTNDVATMTPKFLIDNIDIAFNTWSKASWKNDILFSDFCEYILPYRLGNESLESWREEIFKDSFFCNIQDSLHMFKTVKAAAKWITPRYAKEKKNFVIHWGVNSSNVPDLPYSILNYLSTGTCTNLNQITLFLYRAAGFPIANDFTPHWSNNIAGHNWAAILTPAGSIPFTLSKDDSLGKYTCPDYIPSKVYRSTFSENPKSHIRQRGYCNFLPTVFNDPRIIDVTDMYAPVCEIYIKINKLNHNEKFAYLAVSDLERWIPVAWGTIQNGKARFPKTVRKSVYLPVLISKKRTDIVNYPLIVNENGIVQYLSPNHNVLQSINLFRKFPLRSLIKTYTNRMVNGKFQGSNDIDFKNAITLYTISKDPGVYYNEKLVKSKSKYRYVRYLGINNSHCNVAEIEFYEMKGLKPLKGRVIGIKGNKPIENAFDGNVLTYYDAKVTKESSWVGLDLGKPTEISKIRFVSRNDKNHIIQGDKYELFYWDNDWKSLGQQIAKGRMLTYDKVPTNSLYILKNNSEGREERIFTYEKGKQVWW